MLREKILSIYDQCINNPSILQMGQQFLEDYLKGYEDFACGSIEIILDRSVDFQLRKYIGMNKYLYYLKAYLLKNVLISNWEILQKRELITQLLTKGLVENAGEPIILEWIVKHSSQLLQIVIITQIIRKEKVSSWKEFFYFLLDQININVVTRQSFLEVLLFLFQQLGDEMNMIANQSLTILLQLMLNNSADRLTIIHIVYYIIKSFTHLDQTDSVLLSQLFDSTFQQWMVVFTEILKSKPKLFLHIKVHTVRCLQLIFGDLKSYSKLHKEDFASLLLDFLPSLADLFVKVKVKNHSLANLTELSEIIDFNAKQENTQGPSYIDYYDEQFAGYTEENLVSVLVYNSIQLQMLFHVSNEALYQSLINCSLLTFSESVEYSPFYFLPEFFDDEPSIRKLVLLIFETHFSANKLKQPLNTFFISFLQKQENSWHFYEVKYWLVESFCEMLSKKYPQLMNELINTQEQDLTNKGCILDIYLKRNVLNKETKLLGSALLRNKAKLHSLINWLLKFTTKLASLKNMAILLAKADENKELVSFLSNQQIYNSVISIMTNQDEDLLHIILDSILQFLKVQILSSYLAKYSKELIPIYGELVIPIMVANIQKFQHDMLIQSIMTETFEVIASHQQGWEVIYKQFMSATGFVWLATTRILTKNAPSNQHLELMAQRLPQLVQWMLVNLHDSDQYIQATLLLSTFIKYVNNISEDLINQFYQLINLMLLNYEDQEKQQSTLQCHQIILGIWCKLCKKQFDVSLINKVACKLVSIDVPSSIEGLAVILSIFISFYPEQTITYLESLPIQEVNQLLSKWLKFSKVFSGKNQINILCQGILKILKQSPVKWHDLGFDDGINKPLPLFTKMLETLISFFEVKGSQSMHDIGLFDAKEDDDEEENEDQEWEEEGSEHDDDGLTIFDADLQKPTKVANKNHVNNRMSFPMSQTIWICNSCRIFHRIYRKIAYRY